jgi:hypothetical protein
VPVANPKGSLLVVLVRIVLIIRGPITLYLGEKVTFVPVVAGMNSYN